MSTTPSSLQNQRTFLGHPVGLYVLFFTEMWERFSYYGMRALLMLYMVNFFRWSQQEASVYYKIYTTSVYVTPILGGYLADRYLGNKRAVIIGAVLMAIGHFLMAFEQYQIFISALVFLILGNGFFKPNMSTQVGRLYPANDGRRDGAYTIFYMGINLGAFMSPLLCGWLQENTVGGFHSGFTMAGIGMVIGLLTYLVGQPFVREIDPRQAPAAAKTTAATGSALTEEQAASEPSRLGVLYKIGPAALGISGAALMLVVAPLLWYSERFSLFDAIMIAIGGACLMLMMYVCRQVQGGVRDRVLAILAMGIFVIFFFAAFEQAGNVLNVWADKITNRYITAEPQAPPLVPQIIEDPLPVDGEAQAAASGGILSRFSEMFQLKPKPGREEAKGWGKWLRDSFNPMPTAWFQSINALAIFVIAPLFAWMWVALDRRGWQPSIPVKMAAGLLLMSSSMAVMIAAAERENQPTSIEYSAANLPAGLEVDQLGHVGRTVKAKFEPFQAGRLTFDKNTKTLSINGVLPDNERDHIIEQTTPEPFKAKVDELAEASKEIDGKDVKSVEVKLDQLPPGFDMAYSGIKRSIVSFRDSDSTLVAHQPLQTKEIKGLLVAGGEPNFRQTAGQLFLKTADLRVSAWWLFWTYILATLGELCLSPVGLSMVSKLAPAKFATMLMGVWLLTSAFGNFVAGAMGEVWGTVPPVQFFLMAAVIVGGSALVLLLISRIIVAAMHGVK